jgi:hypothetical protein
MSRQHVHGPACAPSCAREWDLDEKTETSAFRIVTRQGYGNRPKHDKPRWWPFAFHAYKALVQLAGLVGLAWLAKKLGLTVGAP